MNLIDAQYWKVIRPFFYLFFAINASWTTVQGHFLQALHIAQRPFHIIIIMNNIGERFSCEQPKPKKKKKHLSLVQNFHFCTWMQCMTFARSGDVFCRCPWPWWNFSFYKSFEWARERARARERERAAVYARVCVYMCIDFYFALVCVRVE